EDLPPDTLARPFVQRVVDDADDLDVELGIRAATLSEVSTDSALIPEEIGGEALVDDRELRVLLHVRQREVATLENRDSHCLEIFRRQRIHVRLHVFAVGRLVSLNGGSLVPLAPAQDWDGGQRRRRRASRSARPTEPFLI